MMGWKKGLLVVALVCVCCHVVASSTNDSLEEEEQRAMKNLILHADAVKQEVPSKPVTKQEQIDAIKSAFLKLPSEELQRLGVDARETYIAGTEKAVKLEEAWSLRQKELKEIMERQMKAVDYMGNATMKLKDDAVEDDEIEFQLEELEELLTDIDNARDFHTIGGWPVLTSLLPGRTSRSLKVQSKAIHCVGTAIKNDYDFQMWVMEKSGGEEGGGDGLSVLEVLLNTLDNSSQLLVAGDFVADETVLPLVDDVVRKVLYAISAAVRGNLDVQAALPGCNADTNDPSTPSSFSSLLMRCIESPLVSLAVKRKSWHMVSDLLDEMVYIRHDVVREFTVMQGEDKVVPENIEQLLASLRPSGAMFVSPEADWLQLAQNVAVEIASSCSLHEGSDAASPSHPISENSIDDCFRRTSPTVRDIFTHAVNAKKILLAEYDSSQSRGDATYDADAVKKVIDMDAQVGSVLDAYSSHPLFHNEL